MFKMLSFGAVLLWAAVAAAAGPYSVHSNDPGNPHDSPIGNTDPRIVVWADSIIDYSPAPGVGVFATWPDGVLKPELGYASPITGIGSLGDLYDPNNQPEAGKIPDYSGATQPYSGNPSDTTDEYGFIGHDAPGSITVGFPRAIRNGDGPDFAVFENGADFDLDPTTGLVAELAYVEVSTDGVNFARFDAVSLNTDYIDATWGTGTGSIDETNVYNLAGKHLNGWGTPFELAELATNPLVADGLLDLDDVRFVRLVDVPGINDGTYTDSLGNGILDAWVTVNSGGYDFRLSEGVGVLNAVPEPGSITLLAAAAAAMAMLAIYRRRRAG
ncbi:MAG: PEP-CTERM sorting domain-containing protein [Candidatus Nealsonbacteria bacterium]|nr:PEP-CTERM sorting domain-containing protein [Candidatus Nealsonbacteria bacterium]